MKREEVAKKETLELSHLEDRVEDLSPKLESRVQHVKSQRQTVDLSSQRTSKASKGKKPIHSKYPPS